MIPEKLHPTMFYVGMSVNIFNRILRVTAYANSTTRNYYEADCAMIMVLKGTAKLGVIVGLAQDNGFSLCSLKTIKLTLASSAALPASLDTIKAGTNTLVVLELRGRQQVDSWVRTLSSYNLSDDVKVSLTSTEEGAAEYEALPSRTLLSLPPAPSISHTSHSTLAPFSCLTF